MKTFTEMYNEDVVRVRSIVDSNTEWLFSDAEEIGSSDISCCVRYIYEELGLKSVTDDEFAFIRGMVRNAIAMLAY